jgi:hypothetical protein
MAFVVLLFLNVGSLCIDEPRQTREYISGEKASEISLRRTQKAVSDSRERW